MRTKPRRRRDGSTLKALLAVARRVGGERFGKGVRADSRYRTVLAKRIAIIAARLESKDLHRCVVDLVDLYSAARQYCDELDRLTRPARIDLRTTARALTRVQTILHQETMYHLVHLKTPLARAINGLWKRVDRLTRTAGHDP